MYNKSSLVKFSKLKWFVDLFIRKILLATPRTKSTWMDLWD